MRRTVKLVDPPGLPQQTLLPSGRWQLDRDLVMEVGGELFLVPAGFTHDGSSWPRKLAIVLAFALCGAAVAGVPAWVTVLLLLLLAAAIGPAHVRTLIAGIVHDYCFRYARFGKGGRRVGFIESNQVWYAVARAGPKGTSAGPVWATLGRVGLAVAGAPTWIRYRWAGR